MGKRARLDLGDCDERSTYASFVAAANAVSQLYAQGQAQQKRAAITASKAVLERVLDFVLRQCPSGDSLPKEAVIQYLQYEYEALESSIIPASAPPAGPGNTSAGGGTTPAGAPTAEEQAAGSGKPSRYHATIPVASGRRGIIGLPGPESVHGNLHHPQHLLQQQMLPPHLLHQVHTHHACLTSEPGSGDGPMDVLGSLSPPPPPLSAFSQAPGACGPMQGQALLPTSFMQGLVEGTGPGSMH